MRLLLLALVAFGAFVSAENAPIDTLKDRAAAAVEVEEEGHGHHHGHGHGHHNNHHNHHHNNHHHPHGKSHPHGGHHHHHLKDETGLVETENKGLYCQQFQTYSTCHYNANNGCSWAFSGQGATKCSCDNYGGAYNAATVANDNPTCPNNGNAASLCFGGAPSGFYNLGSAASAVACDNTVTQNYLYYYAYQPSSGTCFGGGYAAYNGASSNGGQPLVQASNATPSNCQVIIARTDGGQIN